MAYSEEERRSIVFQTAFKGGVAIASTLPGDEESKTSAAIRIAEELKAYLWDFHGWGDPKPVAHVTGGTVELVQDAFPGTTEVTEADTQAAKQPRRVTPPNMAQSSGQQGYEFKNQKGPIPSWFWSNKNVQGNPGIKVWYDERDDNGDVVVAASGNFRPAFKSVIAKGADRDSQLAVFPPKNG